jgi:spore germination cell wall hydrolase CwlJ-like protein
MNDYWGGLIEYSKKRDKKEKMKNTIITVGSVIIDAIIAFIIINMVAYALLCLMAYSANADEALSPNERVVALTLLGEARGEGLTGIYAVGCVIQKRAENRKLTPAQVCKQRKQFSIWNGVKKESDLWYLYETPNKDYARYLARKICAGRKLSQDYTGNADHYYSHKIMKKPPYWAKGKKPTKVIGNHTFYKLR